VGTGPHQSLNSLGKVRGGIVAGKERGTLLEERRSSISVDVSLKEDVPLPEGRHLQLGAP